MLEAVDWGRLFEVDTPFLEIFVRGTLMYLGIFTVLRVISKRVSGTVGISDLLLITLIADAAQNGMTGGYGSVTCGLLLVATVVFWSFLLDLLSWRFPLFHRLLQPPSLKLVSDGKTIPENLRRELLTEEDLEGKLRLQGVERVKDVKTAMMEGEGGISVIRKE